LFLKKLSNLGVATVGFDILFVDTTSKQEDDTFARSLQQFKKAVLGAAITSGGEIELPAPEFQENAFSV